MLKPYMIVGGCLVAAGALAVGPAGAAAQERGGPGFSGHEMMAQAQEPEARGPMMRSDRGERSERFARWRERRLARRMEILDTDKDGKVTLEEIHAEQRRLISAADVDGDGELSVEEFRRRGRWLLRLRTVSFFDMLDANGDGKLSVAEINDPSARWFARHDENSDKALDADELGKSGWHRGHRRGRHR